MEYLPEEAINIRTTKQAANLSWLVFSIISRSWCSMKEIQVPKGGIYNFNNGFACSLGKF